MEAAIPIMTPKQEMDISLITTLSKNNTVYKVKIGKSKNNESLIISINLNDFDYDKSDYFYQTFLSFDSIIHLGKYFRVCDNLDEVIECFNKIIESTEIDNEFQISEINDDNIILFIKTKLATGKNEKIEIKLKKVKKDKDQLIKELKDYIRLIKDIPDVQKAINKYYQNLNSINSQKIENKKQIKFQKQNVEEKYDGNEFDKESIETVMNEGKCSRQTAVEALRAHNGDPVEALLGMME